ncbi:MAG: DNA methyltransferase [Chloroflexi bacterium]|nr:DNA methyltransferase [Chloroflexota bacterium]
MPPESVDLIYLDPPFNSKRDYNIPLGGKAQANVFQDTWVWSATQDEALEYVATRDATLYQQLEWLLKFASSGTIAGSGGLPAYLAYMAARLLACQRVMKETASIYLHCDPTAGHYLKLLLDAVFGSKNFRNEIVWCYTGPGSPGMRQFNRKHDSLYWFSKGSSWTFNRDSIRIPHKSLNTNRKGAMITKALTAEDREAYLKKGKIPETWWTEFSPVGRLKSERLGYPTQKPLKLLERIIRASSNEGDLVLDPFCGCGTAVEAAQNLGRRWLGIDVEPLAVDLMARRLRERCGIDPTIRGIPYDFAQAQRLAESAPYEFERWAIRLIPGAQPNFKQSGDGGLDGRAVVNVERRPQPLFGFQVKGGKQVGRPALDAFHGALTMNGCAAGLLVVLEERTAHRLRGQLGAQERVQLNGWLGPRIGVWSVEDWLAGRRGAPVPPLVGAGETLDLLQPQNWQRRLNAGVQ